MTVHVGDDNRVNIHNDTNPVCLYKQNLMDIDEVQVNIRRCLKKEQKFKIRNKIQQKIFKKTFLDFVFGLSKKSKQKRHNCLQTREFPRHKTLRFQTTEKT